MLKFCPRPTPSACSLHPCADCRTGGLGGGSLGAHLPCSEVGRGRPRVDRMGRVVNRTDVAHGIGREDALAFLPVATGVRVGSLLVGVASMLAAAGSTFYRWAITE